MMNEELEQLAKNLRLKRMAEMLPQEIAKAQKEDSSYAEFLLRLLRAQWHNRQETALAWRIKQARLPEQWTIESFPFKLPARRQPTRDHELGGARVHPAGREHRLHRAHGRRKDRTRLRAPVEGSAKRLPRPLHSSAGSLRRNVRLACRSLHTSAPQPACSSPDPAHR